MNMPCVYEDRLGETVAAKAEGCRRFAAGTHEPGIGPGGGFFTLPNTILHEGPRQQALFLNELQRIAARTRLGIPLLQTEEGTHGLMCSGGTIFPEGPGLGSTWNLALLREVYAATAREARAIGVHQAFTLVVEPSRDPRLGRNQEGYSEDPWLVSRIAEAIVEAVQGRDVSLPDKVVAGLCHFPGQSQGASGLERGAMEISERMLRETFLPPWVAGIRGRGALGVMATYPAIDGVPVHASEKILTRLLREELGFDGLVLSEGGGLSTLLYEGLAPGMSEAGALALRAGVDVGISYEDGYMGALVENVRAGRVDERLVDRAVRRILKQKVRLGLFERVLVDPERAAAVVHAPEHRELALRAAREGMVLLKNEQGALPLRRGMGEIAVLGPNADDPRNQLGDYTAKVILQDVVTVLEGVRAKAGRGTRVVHVKGCDVIGEGTDEVEAAVAAARRADVAIVVLGESEWQAPGKTGTSGEGFDVASLDLTGRQEELLRAVHATGTPTVLVLVNGRPLSVRWAAEHVPAILEAWLPGERGGEAVAEVLFGDREPEGRLPVTVPRHVGQLPVAYDHKPSKAWWIREGWGKPYADMSPEPLYPFGHGLSYTRFSYSALRVSPSRIARDGTVGVSVDVTNAGARPGAEVVQLYLRDPVASVVVPVQRLRGFEKVRLRPGETRTVRFTLGPDELALLDASLRWVVEPGAFEVALGGSSRDLPLAARFEVVP
jgi:beta-glucosidase